VDLLLCFQILMIVSDFDLERIVTAPDKTNSILVVDANTMLPLPISPQLFYFVSRGNFQIVQDPGSIDHNQFSLRDAGWRRSAGFAGSPDLHRQLVG
jgi:hypothetical protein